MFLHFCTCLTLIYIFHISSSGLFYIVDPLLVTPASLFWLLFSHFSGKQFEEPHSTLLIRNRTDVRLSAWVLGDYVRGIKCPLHFTSSVSCIAVQSQGASVRVCECVYHYQIRSKYLFQVDPEVKNTWLQSHDVMLLWAAATLSS